MQKPVLSVVDYAAWERGYMPPSEHCLIDALAYRGAKVVTSSTWREGGFWFVVQGKSLTKNQRAVIRKMMELWYEVEDDGDVAQPEEVSSNSDPEQRTSNSQVDGSNPSVLTNLSSEP